MTFCRCISLLAVLAFFAFAPRVAGAVTLLAPLGGRAIPLPPGVSLCRDALLPDGWTAGPDGRSVLPPTEATAIGQVATARVAATPEGCASQSSPVDLVAVGTPPQVDATSVVVDVDSRQVTLRGHGLHAMLLRWSSGNLSGEDTCAPLDPVGTQDRCAFAVARGLPADPTQIQLSAWPAGTRDGTDAVLYDANGTRVDAASLALRVSSVVITQLFAADSALDVSSGLGRIPLVHPEAMSSVWCVDATCSLSNGEVFVSDEHGNDDELDVHMVLRPHVTSQRDGQTNASPVADVALQRCPVAVASPPLRGAVDQRIVVHIGGQCARDTGFDLTTTAGPGIVERTVNDAGWQYVVARVPAIDADDLAVVVRRGGSIVGIAHAPTRRLATLRMRLELVDHGAIDFVPTNREARVLVPSVGDDVALVPVPVEGVYDVRRDDTGAMYIHGIDGVAGSVALRLAYRNQSLPPSLRDINLAEITEPVDRPLRAANLPVPLVSSDPAGSIVELVCGDGEGHTRQLSSGTTSNIPYRARDSCKLVLHRERLRVEDGTQALRVTVSVTSSDGTPRTDAHLDRRIVLRPSDTPLEVMLSGAEADFDRMLVQLALSDEGDHYAVPPDEHIGAPRAQWALVMGTAHARIYATTAIPTGLFRLADAGHSGILSLNAGAILRAVLLTREGNEIPVGVEAGVMWLGIAGDVDHSAATGGEVAVVAGLGVSVPIANTSRATQTSINLHAWLEYEVSRTVLGQSGSPFGVVFGPSISIGDVGTSF